MKIGGGLNFVTGPMGAGKSLYAVRKIVASLVGGGYVVTNVALLPGWPDLVARHVGRTASPARRREIAKRCAARYVFERDISAAMDYRLPGKGEARGAFIWDEGHNDLNNRSWKDDGRAELLTWATQLRKLGFVGYLLSQSAENTDAALRRVCNFHVRLQNQREQTRVFGLRLRIAPPLFLAWWYPANLGRKGVVIPPVRTERYFLSWHRHLYDTFDLYHGLAEADEGAADRLILLPDAATLARAGFPPREAGGRQPEASKDGAGDPLPVLPPC